MSASHIHIALTHLPVIGIIFSGILLLIAFLTMDKKLQRVSYWFIFFVAISAIPVFLSGEPTEEIIEKLAGVSESFIEEHELIATISFITMIVLGLLSIIGLIIYRNRPMFHIQPILAAISGTVRSGQTLRSANPVSPATLQRIKIRIMTEDPMVVGI